MPIKAYYLEPEGSLQRNLSKDDVIEIYEAKQGLLWIDVSETTEDDGIFLEQNLHFHHLTVEDCVSQQIHPPKIDNFGDYIFIIVHGVNYTVESDIVETAELEIFLGKHFVVSNHSFPLYCISAVEQMIEADAHPMKSGADFLMHSLIDALVDNFMPTIDSMSNVAEEIEEAVIHSPQPVTLDGIMKLKRSTLRVHRVMAPQREVLNRLSRGEFTLIKVEAQIFYSDIYDHVVRIEELNQTIRERSDNALATYLSSVANRQNETMRILSIVATIFLPLTLLVGIYGMNWEYMPELKWRWGYFAVQGIILLVILIVIWRFWVSGWFAWGRRHITWKKPFRVNGNNIRGYITPKKKQRKEPQK
ncbi:magnesium/cobalt transporter CorA [Chloroflexota bacterium]